VRSEGSQLINFLEVIAGLTISLFLPGFTSSFLLLPRKNDLDWIERLAIGFGMNAVLVVLTGFMLGGHERFADFWHLVTGTEGISAVNLWLVLSAETFVMFIILFYRNFRIHTLSMNVEKIKGAFEKFFREILSRFSTKPAEFAQWVRRSNEQIILLFVLLFSIALKAYPLYYFGGFPYGDTDMAVFWGLKTIKSHMIPDYSYASTFGLRPSDISTPGLHMHLASVGLLTNIPLVFVSGIIVVFLSLAGSLLIYAITYQLTQNRKEAILATLFLSCTLPFLRYTNKPGEHYQNLMGEVFILLIIVLFLIGANKKRFSPYIAAFVCMATLVTIHALSTFIFAFIFLGMASAVIIFKGKEVKELVRTHTLHISIFSILLISTSIFLILGPQRILLPELLKKFMGSPPQQILLVPLTQYSLFLGKTYLPMAFVGAFSIFCAKKVLHKEEKFRYTCLLLWIAAIFFLTQGPRFGIGIHPARVIYYLAPPLALLASIGAYYFLEKLKRILYLGNRRIILGCLTIVIIGAPVLEAGYSMSNTFEFVKVSPRACNLDAETYGIVKWLEGNTSEYDKILVDYIRSGRLEWLLASGRRVSIRMGWWDMFVIVQREYASDPRPETFVAYKSQRDFNKIFMMGNNPISLFLLKEHNFTYLVTTRDSMDIFSTNPFLILALETQSYIIYKVDLGANVSIEEHDEFLLSPLTLANDLGDSDDFLAGSEVFLDPLGRWRKNYTQNTTTQINTNTTLSVYFDVYDYVSSVWDRDGDGHPDEELRLLLRYFDNGVDFSVHYLTEEATLEQVGSVSGNDTGEFEIVEFKVGDVVSLKEWLVSFEIRTKNASAFILDWVAMG